MSDTTDLNTHYKAVQDGERAILLQIKALADALKTDLAAILPMNAGNMTSGQQYFARVNQMINNLFGFDLTNVLQQYPVESAA